MTMIGKIGSWFRRGEKKASYRDIPDSIDEWRVGDLAVCAYDGDWTLIRGTPPPIYPAIGETWHVIKVDIGEGPQLLSFTEAGADHRFSACSFIKVRPDEHKAADEEFVNLLRRKVIAH